MAGFEKQAEEHCCHLWKAKELLSIIRENIEALKKELEGKGEEISKAEHATCELVQKETAEGLKSQLKKVCWGFCLHVWAKILNAIGIVPSLELRDPRRVVFPFALKSTTISSTLETSSTASTSQSPTEGENLEKVVGKGGEAAE